MKHLFIAIVLSIFTHVAVAEVPAGGSSSLPIWYQAVGVVTTEQSEIGTADFYQLELEHFTTATACENAIKGQNGLLTLSGVETPSGGKKVFQNAGGVCHPVLPYQMSGWKAIGTAIVQQYDRQSKRLPLTIGPFADKETCEGAIVTQNSLTLQNTPITGRNVGYKAFASCRLVL